MTSGRASLRHSSPRESSERPQISIVVARDDAQADLRGCVQALRAACRDLQAEIIVVDASPDAAAVPALDGQTAVLRLAHPKALVPHLWAFGVSGCRGHVVALTTADVRVDPGWARALLAGIDDGAAACGGPLRPARTCGPAAWGIFYLRFWSHLADSSDGPRPVSQLPGENVAYRSDQLDRRRALLSHGLWEVDVNRAITADGGALVRTGEAAVEFAPAQGFGRMVRTRIAHGRHSGASRTRRGERTAWQVVAASPIVPLVLAVRAGRRALAARHHRLRFVLGLPWFLVLAGAWAIGEVRGAIGGAHVAALSELTGST